MKRIVICMDGTWQTLSQQRPTNISLIARSVAHTSSDGTSQIVIYEPGVGSSLDALKSNNSAIVAFNKTLTSMIGGAFGDGLEDGILDTYLRLAFNYEAGDQIYIFGFSRGAFSARSLAGLIGKCGIVSRRFAASADEAFALYRDPNVTPTSPEAIQFRKTHGKREGTGAQRHSADHRPHIAYLGIFDTVGQRGLPLSFGPLSEGRNKKYAFHDLELGSHVLSARHALAIDEHRRAFPPTPWTNMAALNAGRRTEGANMPDPYQQRWFAGGHGDVGGGNVTNLSSIPLEWIAEGAELAGLQFDRTSESPLTLAVTPEFLDPSQQFTVPGFWSSLVNPINWTGAWRTIANKGDTIDRAACESTLHPSVPYRSIIRMAKPYAPPPLRPFKSAIQEVVAVPALFYTLVALVQEKPKRRKFLGLF